MAKLIYADALYKELEEISAALGRMYATSELVSLIKKIESGKLVEVVRCKDCKHCMNFSWGEIYCGRKYTNIILGICENDFCSHGERKDNENICED